MDISEYTTEELKDWTGCTHPVPSGMFADALAIYAGDTKVVVGDGSTPENGSWCRAHFQTPEDEEIGYIDTEGQHHLRVETIIRLRQERKAEKIMA